MTGPRTPPGITPDYAGFWNAHERKRELLGEDVIFLENAEVTWPPDAVLDLEGHPLDPTVQPIASGQASAVVRCEVFFRAMMRSSSGHQEIYGPAGIQMAEHVMVIASIADRPTIEPCTTMIARGDKVQIVSMYPDELGAGGPQRFVVYGRHAP